MNINHKSVSVNQPLIVPSQPANTDGDIHNFDNCDVWMPKGIAILIHEASCERKIQSIRWLRAMYYNLGLGDAKRIVEYYIENNPGN